MTGVLKSGNLDTEAHVAGDGHVNTKMAVYEPRGQAQDSPPLASEGTNPADTLTLDFRPPELRQYISVVEATQLVVFCYDSTRKLMQLPNADGIRIAWWSIVRPLQLDLLFLIPSPTP